MVERYFILPTTVDHIRESWLVDQIETYVGWLAGRGCRTTTIRRRVSLLEELAGLQRFDRTVTSLAQSCRPILASVATLATAGSGEIAGVVLARYRFAVMGEPGRYRIARRIAAGGMGEVLEGFLLGDGGFERKVIIKRILPRRQWSEAAVRRFIDEARIASALHHANIVSVFDFGMMDERPFLAAEYVDGIDVGALYGLASDSGASG